MDDSLLSLIDAAPSGLGQWYASMDLKQLRYFLGVAESVDGGGIDPIHTVVERGVDGADGFVVVLGSPGECPSAAAHCPGADADGGEVHIAVAKPSFLHLYYNNVANRPIRKGMSITGIASLGMEEAQKKLERTAEQLARTESPPEDMVELLSARNRFVTNARVIQTAEEMQKRLIDILA